MIHLIEKIATWAVELIAKTGYTGLFVTMALESAAIPIPSEVVVPFGGFLASEGRFNFAWVVLVVTLANLTGSMLLYFAGVFGGRPLLERYGKYVLIHRADIEKMDFWLQKYGKRVAFFSRLLPGMRTFSSIVIGAGGIKFPIFFWYTLIGSLVWNLLWAYAGYLAGANWNQFQPYVRKFDFLIIFLIAAGIIYFVWRHIKKNRHI
jgi:membrane protein DedA with SNARE-associated domain